MEVERQVEGGIEKESSSYREEDIQQRIEQAKRTVDEATIHDTFVLEFNATKQEGTEFQMERGDISFSVELMDHYGLRPGVERSIELSKQDKAYIPILVLSFAGKKRVFMTGVHTSQDRAEQKLPKNKQQTLPFKFTNDSSEKIQYGMYTSLRQHVPQPIEKILNKEIYLCVGILLALIPLFAIHIGAVIAYTIALMVFTYTFELFESFARVTDNIELDELYEHVNGEREFDVVTCEFETTVEGIRIFSPEHDAEWVYKKNSMGELPQEGKQALDAVSIEGDECIACISSTHLDQQNTIESNCESWQLEHLDT